MPLPLTTTALIFGYLQGGFTDDIMNGRKVFDVSLFGVEMLK
jgi:hypothetical protein